MKRHKILVSMSLLIGFSFSSPSDASINFSRRARDIFRELRVKVAEINTRFSETISGIRVVQLFRQEEPS